MFTGFKMGKHFPKNQYQLKEANAAMSTFTPCTFVHMEIIQNAALDLCLIYLNFESYHTDSRPLNRGLMPVLCFCNGLQLLSKT